MNKHQDIKEIQTLEPAAAIKLWQSGRDEWNLWVAEHHECNVYFENVDFSAFRTDTESGISFKGFNFPNGAVSFNKAEFGEGDVSFMDAKFREGNVFFSGAKFGDGNVGFNGAKFGDGNVDFNEAKFGDGNLDFNGTEFGDGDVYFIDVKFGDGCVDFYQAEFGDGDLNFYRAEFGKGYVNFQNAKFGDGDVSFNEAEFGDGNVDFNDAKFGHGDVEFNSARFGDCIVDFRGTKLGDGEVRFYDATFMKGNVDFDEAEFGEGSVYFHISNFGECKVSFENIACKARFNLSSDSKIQSLSFRGATFEKTVSISQVNVLSIVDLVNTKLSNQLSLHGLTCKLKTLRNRFGFRVAQNIDDIERLTRLKELAETNKHHALALTFHADEMRANRWQAGTPALSSVMDLAFDLLCKYGRSVMRPFLLLVSTWPLFGLIYATMLSQLHSVKDIWGSVLTFTVMNSIPFLAIGRESRNAIKNSLFDGFSHMNWLYLTIGLQGVVSVSLLFLIGLGLRNRFRL